MAIEIDFGRELGRLAFPDDITDEQAKSYVRENYQAIRQGLLDRRRQELAAETESEEAAKFRAGEYGTVETAINTLSEFPKGALKGIGEQLVGIGVGRDLIRIEGGGICAAVEVADPAELAGEAAHDLREQQEDHDAGHPAPGPAQRDDTGGDQRVGGVVPPHGGGPVGVETMAAALSEPRDAIEDIIEPYLIQCGYLQRTPRGRLLTGHAFRHLGLAEPTRDPSQFGFFGGGDGDQL